MFEPIKIEVRFQLTDDNRLRVWSPDVPGFRLSHHDHKAVMADIIPALETILAERFDTQVRVRALNSLADKNANIPMPAFLPKREYVTDKAA